MSEYPKMLYKSGACEDHSLWGVPLPISGVEGVAHRTVASADEELAALEEGWRDTLDDTGPEKGRRAKAA